MNWFNICYDFDLCYELLEYLLWIEFSHCGIAWIPTMILIPNNCPGKLPWSWSLLGFPICMIPPMLSWSSSLHELLMCHYPCLNSSYVIDPYYAWPLLCCDPCYDPCYAWSLWSLLCYDPCCAVIPAIILAMLDPDDPCYVVIPAMLWFLLWSLLCLILVIPAMLDPCLHAKRYGGLFFQHAFTWIWPGWEGSAHDLLNIHRGHGETEHELPSSPHEKYYVIDAGYPNTRGYLAPYRCCRYYLQD